MSHYTQKVTLPIMYAHKTKNKMPPNINKYYIPTTP